MEAAILMVFQGCEKDQRSIARKDPRVEEVQIQKFEKWRATKMRPEPYTINDGSNHLSSLHRTQHHEEVGRDGGRLS